MSQHTLSSRSSTPSVIDEIMPDKVPLTVLIKFIKPFTGQREALPGFLTNCDNAVDLANDEQQIIIFKYILSQLEGKAQVAASLRVFESWKELKAFLRSTFGEQKHHTHLLADLQNCRQNQNESVTQYSLRLEGCLTRLQSDLHHSCTKKTELEGRVAEIDDLALNAFIIGINPSIATVLRCRNPKSLNEAITLAIEEEKVLRLTRPAPVYHRPNPRPNSNPNSFPKFGYNRPVNTSENKSYYSAPKQGDKTCYYCKKPGHVISECRKRQYNNSHRTPETRHMPDSRENAGAQRFSEQRRPTHDGKQQAPRVHFNESAIDDDHLND